MKEVLYINKEEPISLTHFLSGSDGWIEETVDYEEGEVDKILYLGKCEEDGDMFAVYLSDGVIVIWKGYLNDGVY